MVERWGYFAGRELGLFGAIGPLYQAGLAELALFVAARPAFSRRHWLCFSAPMLRQITPNFFAALYLALILTGAQLGLFRTICPPTAY
jgi:hypothetical protein